MSSYEPPVGHILHSSFGHGMLRELSAFESKISPVNLMLPLFVTNSSPDALEPINALPGVSRYGVNNVLHFLSQQVEKGLRSIIIFGVDVKNTKDKVGSSADNDKGPTIEAIKIIKAKYPQLWVAADVCICPFSETGHCAIFEDGHMDNQKSIDRLAEIAGSYALAGADCVAPSDMMDGRIGAIKSKLRELKLGSRVAVMSYSAKFCSAYYGPFREAAGSAPKFGDRRNYQLPPGASKLAMRCNSRDVDEGADILMVKPAGAYLDIIYRTKQEHPHFPVAAYQVSGEYALLFHGAKAGAIDLKRGVLESLTACRRAGAELILSYFTPQVLQWLDDDEKAIRAAQN